MKLRNHPLLQISELHHQLSQPAEDQSGKLDNRLKHISFKEKIKRLIGFYVYPFKNRVERKQLVKKLNSLSGNHLPVRMADIISKGQKGAAPGIFLYRINKIINKQPALVIAYGCGTGEEVFNIAKYLKPKKIVGIDYFNYDKIWELVVDQVKTKFGIEVEFLQLDFNKPQKDLLESADMIYSQAVLEHLRDMNGIFSTLKSFLKKDGYFAAQWGPMWYSFSGDHIAAELGLEKGFEHLLLSTDKYVEFYKTHPRNRESVEAGEKTWLELGLHNFATNEEYINCLEEYFGDIQYLHWVVSEEAIIYQEKFQAKWDKILELNPFISGFDLMVPCAGILLKNRS